MSLNLKIKLGDSTKVMRFAENMSIGEAIKVIQEKTTIGGKDHGLFKPSHESEKTVGQWMRMDKTLEFYDLNPNQEIEYKKKHDVIKIRMVDDSIKTVLVDTSLPARDVVELIAKKLNLKNWEEYSLQETMKPDIWLKPDKSIPEQVESMEQEFKLKKKYFVSDQSVNIDDPVSLHLVYCQSRDDIIEGKHPCTRDEIVAFAALQAQVSVGNFNPDQHKPGYLNLKEFFSPDYRNKECEKKALDEWKKLVGMNEVNAKYRYVQLCRSLKTYGMTVFHVKDKIGEKKKLKDALLCFTRNSIIRMDYETKKVVKEYPFKHLLRWAASPETFTMDFGTHEDDYVVVITQEGEAISSLVAGYIDLLLKRQRESNVAVDEDDANTAEVESVARVSGMGVTSTSTSSVGGSQFSYAQGVSDCATGARAIERMISDLFGEVGKMDTSNLTPEQRKRQLADQAKALEGLAETLENMAKQANRQGMNQSAQKMVGMVEQMIQGARAAVASGADPNGVLLNAAKGVSEALKKLIAASQEAANKQNDPEAQENLNRARLAAQAALQKLAAASRGVNADEGFQQLFRELAKAVNAETNELLNLSRKAEGIIGDPAKRNQMAAANNNLTGNNEHLGNIANILAPTAQDEACLNSLEKATKALEQSANFALATAKSSGVDPNLQQQLNNQNAKLAESIRRLLGVTELPPMAEAKDASDFTEAAQTILTASASLMASQGNAPLIKQQAELLRGAVAKLGQSGKGILSSLPEGSRERMANYLKQVVEATKGLLQSVPAAQNNPNDENAHRILRDNASNVAEATHNLLGDTGKQVALSALYNSAKLAAANTVNLATASKVANKHLPDPEAQRALDDAARAAAEAVQALVNCLKSAKPIDSKTSALNLRGRNPTESSMVKDDIMQGCETFAPTAYKLVSAAKASSGKVENADCKQNLVYSSSNAAKAIHQMLANRKALKAVKGQLESIEALEQFKAALADLEAAMISADTGILKPTKGKDESLAELAQATQELGKATKNLISTAKNNPEELGTAMKELSATAARAVAATANLAANIEDKNLQKGLLNALHGVLGELRNLMQISKAAAANPDDQALGKLMLDSGKEVVNALVKLTEASKGVIPKKIEDHLKKSATDIEDIAERELQGAANVIENCVQKLLRATQEARERMTAKGISLDEQNITEAILESAQAIASATAVLVNSATAVQREFNQLSKAPATASVYKRDPQWAQGLISAAKTVAGAVQHLVNAANNAAQGNASEEALVVAAQAVSAATTQLVVASTVKSDPNSQSQARLKDAASKVALATQSLVDAARTAAKWEEENANSTTAEQYNLPPSKIRDLEKQMEILRLEKELEKARRQLGQQRREEYQSNVNPDFKPGMPNSQEKKAPVPTGRGTAQAIRGAQGRGVNWQAPGRGRAVPPPPSQQ